MEGQVSAFDFRSGEGTIRCLCSLLLAALSGWVLYDWAALRLPLTPQSPNVFTTGWSIRAQWMLFNGWVEDGWKRKHGAEARWSPAGMAVVLLAENLPEWSACVLTVLVVLPLYVATAVAARLGPVVGAAVLLGYGQQPGDGVFACFDSVPSRTAAAIAVLVAMTSRGIKHEIRELCDAGQCDHTWLSLLSPALYFVYFSEIWNVLDFTSLSLNITVVICVLAPWGSCSRRRDCHPAAPPSPFSRCFNMDEEGMSVK